MANTYTQIYIQVVFSVEGRMNILPREHKEELHQHITGIVTSQKQKIIAINSMPDHVLIGLKSDMALSNLVGKIKSGSTSHINRERWVRGKFSWQEGFGAFPYSHSQLDDVIRYIRDQEKHRAKKTFREEYLESLEKFHVPYDQRYVFQFDDGAAPTGLSEAGSEIYKHFAPNGAKATSRSEGNL